MRKIIAVIKAILIVLSSIWVCLFIWVHQPLHIILTILLIVAWISFAIICIFNRKIFSLKTLKLNAIYCALTLIVIVIFFSLTPSNKREWDPEVAKIATYQFVDGQIEIQNVRNFIWKNNHEYTTQWETRRYDLSQIKSVDLIISHFMKGPIAHAFVSFGFEDGQYLAFSIEIRKEVHEQFSVLGGFFRQYELAIVIGDENDLIYTRSNIRHEKVYIYPINLQKNEIQKLFLVYLNKADELSQNPRWYNTWLTNCTTIIFDLVERVLGTNTVPRDYRVILPGLLPSYLYDLNQLDHMYSLKEWKKMAFINPKIANFNESPDQDQQKFSLLIRSDLPHKPNHDDDLKHNE